MQKKISINDIESLIRKNIKDKGLMNDISEDQVQEIKNKIKHKLALPTAMFGTIHVPHQEYDVNSTDSSTGLLDGGADAVTGDAGMGDGGMNEDVVGSEEENITPEEELIGGPKASYPINNVDPQLNTRAECPASLMGVDMNNSSTSSYEPKLPEFIEKAEPEKIFIFKENELSVGGETLRTMPYHLCDNPDEKMSMEDMWLQKGKIRAEVYQVEFKKIGEIVFRPNDGICKFERTPEAIPSDIPVDDQLTVQQAIQSQEPITPMEDSVEPVLDVTMPMTTDMGLNSPDIQKAAMEMIEKAFLTLMKKDSNSL